MLSRFEKKSKEMWLGQNIKYQFCIILYIPNFVFLSQTKNDTFSNKDIMKEWLHIDRMYIMINILMAMNIQSCHFPIMIWQFECTHGPALTVIVFSPILLAIVILIT